MQTDKTIIHIKPSEKPIVKIVLALQGFLIVGIIFLGIGSSIALYEDSIIFSIIILGFCAFFALIAKRYLDNAFYKEFILTNSEAVTIVYKTWWTRHEHTFNSKDIIHFGFIGEQEFTKHPMENEVFDFTGLGTSERELQYLIKEGTMEIISEKQHLRFGKNIHSWDAEEIQWKLETILGKKFSSIKKEETPNEYLKIETEKGRTEAIIDDDCGYNKFYTIAEIIQNEFKLSFTKKLDDFDSLYWNFQYNHVLLILHYNIYLGVSIFPENFAKATDSENQTVVEISNRLIVSLINSNWNSFSSNTTIGTKGSESGVIILDIENTNGARITIEKETIVAPFAITCGVYGLFFHTEFASTRNEVDKIVQKMKFYIYKILELHEQEEAKRDNLWQTKLDRSIEKIVN